MNLGSDTTLLEILEGYNNRENKFAAEINFYCFLKKTDYNFWIYSTTNRLNLDTYYISGLN